MAARAGDEFEDSKESPAFLLDEEGLLAKHRKEKKELQVKVQKLKNSVPKGDKRKKKEVSDEISKLEQDLQKQQKQELEEFRDGQKGAQEEADSGNDKVNVEDEVTVSEDTEVPLGEKDTADQTQANRKSKAQKRRDKKQAKGKEREERIKEQAVLNCQAPRHLEMVTLKAALKLRGLALHEIAADGNCMYNAVNHQLSCRNLESSNKELREKTADFMRSHRDDFLPFLTHPDTGDMLTEEQFEEYCEKTSKTPMWGGQIELRALSEVLQVPIEVIQADTQPLVIGESMKADPLTLVYHRHVYRLGEHYNSVCPLTAQEEEAEEESGVQ
ncbi:deubiquitinase OTUD6B [Aplysia californica]|uniref:Deubiquitinase OTUD6B n=1 Tax=Aplysia californica TaxID=6500 RepID=A0ABM1ABX4_APLCA|nr:deubiquitinase OTUD6B [Aplysia californica]